MDAIVLTKRQFEKLKQHLVPDHISNSEASLYIIPSKNQFNDKLVKVYKANSGDSFSRKLYVVNTLIDSKDVIGSNDIVLPEKLVVVGDNVVGTSQEYINNNINMIDVINNTKIPMERKIDLLKQILGIINHVKYTAPLVNGMNIGDIHLGNFIYDLSEKRVKNIDTDSYSIGEVSQPVAPMNIVGENFNGLDNKYKFNYVGLTIPNDESDMMYYQFIVLNTIANYEINNLSLNEFYDYLQFLKDNGYSNEVVDCFASIYTNKSNYIDNDILEQLKSASHADDYRSFSEKK